jgi:hypothetical protein
MARTKLRKYNIYHPKEGFLNIMCKLDVCDYEFVASVDARNLVSVFYQAQNDFNPEYASLEKRSTVVGDIVVDADQVHMFRGVGLKRIAKTTPLYKKIMEADEAIQEILSRDKLSDEDINNLIEASVQ